jgi:signal transduction histidine kinase
LPKLTPMFNSLRFRLLLTMSIVVLVAVGTVAIFTSRSTTDQFQRYVTTDIQRNQQLVSQFLTSYQGNPTIENLTTLVKKLADTSSERIVVLEGDGKVLIDTEGTLVGQTLEWPVRPPVFIGTGGEAAAPITSSAGIIFPAPVTITESNGGTTSHIEVAVPISGAVGVTFSDGDPRPGRGFIPFVVIPAPPSTVAGSAGNSVSAPGTPANLVLVRLPRRGGNPNENGFLNSVNQQLLLAVVAAGLVALILTWLLSRRILGPVEALTAAAGRMEKGDLSQRVQVKSHDEIGKLAHAFNSMSDGLSQLEQSRRNMVTDVAHELRTPISNIRGYLEAMRDGVVKPNPALISSLHEEAMLLSRLVEDLQELELAEAGKLKLVRQSVDISDIVGKAVTASQAAANEKGVVLSIDLPDEIPPVEADPERIGQVLRNLLNNAITHTPSGGHVDITASTNDSEIEVSVRDTGSGISPDHLPHIFDRFYRADQSRARETGGSGLGLAIVKELIEMHGGHVRAESTPGHGATFYFTLPIRTRH